MLTLSCPGCKAESKLSFVGGKYEGPFRCYKCHSMLWIKVENNQIVSQQPLTEEELKQRQEIEALRRKFRRPGGEEP